MAADIWYTIKKNRYRDACVTGFVQDGDGLVLNKKEHYHSVYLKALDGVDPGSTWGRLSCEYRVQDEMVIYFYVAATDDREVVVSPGETADISDILGDPGRGRREKLAFMDMLGAKRVSNSAESLLYEMRGRYLYIALEIIGEGDASIDRLRVSRIGDNFMNAFPEIYRERNGFLHRYLSIFSSIYNDIGATGDGMYHLLDVDSASSELLEIFAGWFGIDLRGGFLSEETMRAVVREAYQLNRMKGTRRAIERIMELVLDEKVIIIEGAHTKKIDGGKKNSTSAQEQGGDYDVTILVNTQLSEELHHQLMWLLNQFKPLRARIHLLQLSRNAVMDGNSYLDMNATIPGQKSPLLEETALYDGLLTLN